MPSVVDNQDSHPAASTFLPSPVTLNLPILVSIKMSSTFWQIVRQRLSGNIKIMLTALVTYLCYLTIFCH